ncbi:MAG: lipoprotein insertase outer membrane protein LolB [Casimicrobiaceae bacterium]|nr:lipoprotein insertase outer membrane protein LolB [Pseudomonadota bacterium]
MRIASLISAGIKKTALAALAALVTACASLPPPVAVEAPITALDAPFSIGGRISARRGDAGVAGAFSWSHGARYDAIEISTPLGQTLAKLEGGPHDVTVRLSDGRVERAETWGALTEKAFGVTIPVDGLASWIRGLPRPNARYGVERDTASRVALLRQDGWEVVYAYADDAARKPFRVTLRYPGADPVEVRVVVDRRE